MTTLLVAKQYIKKFISKYEVYLKPLLKLVLALTALMMINGKIGYMQRLDNISVVLIVSLMCSFMPMNFIIFVAALFTVLHMYALSLECAVITLVVFLVLFLLYFRFSPKDTIVVLLTPMSFVLGIPYVMPLVMGLVGTPASVVSVGCGVIVSYLINYIADGANTLSAMETEDMATRFRFRILTGFLSSPAMIYTMARFHFSATLTRPMTKTASLRITMAAMSLATNTLPPYWTRCQSGTLRTAGSMIDPRPAAAHYYRPGAFAGSPHPGAR